MWAEQIGNGQELSVIGRRKVRLSKENLGGHYYTLLALLVERIYGKVKRAILSCRFAKKDLNWS